MGIQLKIYIILLKTYQIVFKNWGETLHNIMIGIKYCVCDKDLCGFKSRLIDAYNTKTSINNLLYSISILFYNNASINKKNNSFIKHLAFYNGLHNNNQVFRLLDSDCFELGSIFRNKLYEYIEFNLKGCNLLYHKTLYFYEYHRAFFDRIADDKLKDMLHYKIKQSLR